MTPTDDPDAMWRPGYTGGFTSPAPAPGSNLATGSASSANGAAWDEPTPGPLVDGRPRRARRTWVVAGIASVVIAAVAAAVVMVVRDDADGPRDRSDESSTLERIPDDVALRWSSAFGADERVVDVVGTSDTIVAAVGSPAELVALEVSSGARRWTSRVPVDTLSQLAVIDGVVITLHVTRESMISVAALDVGTGETLWVQRLERGEDAEIEDGRLFITRFVATVGEERGVSLVDVRTGSRVASVFGGDVRITPTGVVRREDGRIDWFALDDLAPVGSLSVATFSLAIGVALGQGLQEPIFVAPLADGALVATLGTLALVDRRGRLVMAVRAPVSVGPTGDLPPITPLVDDEGGATVIVSGLAGGVSAIRITPDALEVLWTRPGRLLDARNTEDGGRAVIGTSEAPRAIQMIDADTGAPLLTAADDAFQFDFGVELLVGDGLIGRVEVDGAPAAIGVDPSGQILWTLPAASGRFGPVDGGMVVVRSGGAGTSTLELHA